MGRNPYTNEMLSTGTICTSIEAISLCSAEAGGVCTFCGAKVALSSQESSEVRPPFAERSAAPDSQGQPVSSTPTSAAADDKVADAIAFKNRLVRVPSEKCTAECRLNRRKVSVVCLIVVAWKQCPFSATGMA